MTAHAMLVRAMLAVFVVVAAAGVAVGAFGVGACGGGSEPPEIRRDSTAFYDTGPFAEHIDEYLALADAPRSHNAELSPHGKVIFIDVDERHVDRVFTVPLVEAQSPWLAYAPEETATVVLVTRKREQVGVYTSGDPAYVVRATMTVVDLASKKVVATKTFKSGEPPSTALAGFGGEGALPVKKMLAWVEGMAGGQ